jgi:hypothetical protein
MSYHPRTRPLSLGATPTTTVGSPDIMSKLEDYLKKALSVSGTATAVLNDPYLSEAACYVSQLSAIENKTPMPVCPRLPPGKTGGIGLHKFLPAMRAYVFAEQHPVVKPLAVAAVLGVPFLVGYLAGRRR